MPGRPLRFQEGECRKVSLILVVHVDDILISGDEKDVKEVERIPNKKFPINNLGEVKCVYGMYGMCCRKGLGQMYSLRREEHVR